MSGSGHGCAATEANRIIVHSDHEHEERIKALHLPTHESLVFWVERKENSGGCSRRESMVSICMEPKNLEYRISGIVAAK